MCMKLCPGNEFRSSWRCKSNGHIPSLALRSCCAGFALNPIGNSDFKSDGVLVKQFS
jgi:hypothetical protein